MTAQYSLYRQLPCDRHRQSLGEHRQDIDNIPTRSIISVLVSGTVVFDIELLATVWPNRQENSNRFTHSYSW